MFVLSVLMGSWSLCSHIGQGYFTGAGAPVPVKSPWKIKSHWGRVTHICVSKLIIIGSDNGLSPDRRQAIIWTNAGLLLIGPLGTNFSEILIEILISSFKKMRLKVSSSKRWTFCSDLNVLNMDKIDWDQITTKHSANRVHISWDVL